ncbi:MAG: biotin/lipoyl-containing protein [Acidobacteriota bacterium]
MIFALLEPKGTRMVEIQRNGCEVCIVDGEDRFQVDARPVDGGRWSILKDRRSYEARVDVIGSVYEVEIEGRRYCFELADPARRTAKGAAPSGPGPGEVLAPMPGRVMRIPVRLGQKVRRGEAVVVVEAMKMENELTAARDGVVVEIACREGEAVELGSVLLRIGGRGKANGKSRGRVKVKGGAHG